MQKLPAILLFACAAAVAACGSTVSDTTTPAASTSSSASTSIAADPSKSDKRVAGNEVQSTRHWRAFGTEPFWSVSTDGIRLTFTTPEDQKGRVLVADSSAGGDTPTFSGSEGRMQFSLSIERKQCSDGMSDNQYSLAATFNFGDVSYQGCAEEAK